MAVSPVLVIKTIEDSVVSVRVRLYDDFSQHEIVLNSILTYWWANNLPPAIKFLELLESVIKRTINEVMPHKNLNIKYEVKADCELEKASFIDINIIEVEADEIGFKIDGKQLTVNGQIRGEATPANITFNKRLEGVGEPTSAFTFSFFKVDFFIDNWNIFKLFFCFFEVYAVWELI